jgi:transposase
LATKFELHHNRITTWNREFLENADPAFGGERKQEEAAVSTDSLYQQICQLQVENDFFENKLTQSRTM